MERAPLVLLVEDDRQTRELYHQVLSASGFRTVQAHNGHQALEKALAHIPDAIVTDLALPGLDGADLCAKLKSDPRTKHIPVVAVTGHPLDTFIGRARRAGADAVLVKPCLPEDLIAEIHRVLNVPPSRKAI